MELKSYMKVQFIYSLVGFDMLHFLNKDFNGSIFNSSRQANIK